jgi:hypothetical protein
VKTVPDSGTLTKAKPARIAARNKSTGRSISFPPLTTFLYYMYKDPKMCPSYKGGMKIFTLKNMFTTIFYTKQNFLIQFSSFYKRVNVGFLLI